MKESDMNKILDLYGKIKGKDYKKPATKKEKIAAIRNIMTNLPNEEKKKIIEKPIFAKAIKEAESANKKKKTTVNEAAFILGVTVGTILQSIMAVTLVAAAAGVTAALVAFLANAAKKGAEKLKNKY